MRKSNLVLGSISLATVALSAWLWLQLQDARANNVTPQSRVATTQCRDEPAAAPAVAAAPQHDMQAVPIKQAQLGPPPAIPMGRFPGEFQERLLKNPDYRKALKNQQRSIVETEYRDLPEFLGLTPGQADRLFDLLATQGERILEAQWQRPTPERSRQAAFEEARAKNEAELAEFLGPSNTIQMKEFRATMESRVEVDSVRNELARGPEPLREEQVGPMVAAVNVELQRLNQEIQQASQEAGIKGSATLPSGFDPVLAAKKTELTIAANQRILDASKGILTSGQLAGLADLYRRQRQQMLAADEVSRLRSEGRPLIPPPSPN